MQNNWNLATQEERPANSFANYMLAQINSMEKFRQTLLQHTGKVMTPEQAAFIWIARGHAADFRRQYESVQRGVEL